MNGYLSILNTHTVNSCKSTDISQRNLSTMKDMHLEILNIKGNIKMHGEQIGKSIKQKWIVEICLFGQYIHVTGSFSTSELHQSYMSYCCHWRATLRKIKTSKHLVGLVLRQLFGSARPEYFPMLQRAGSNAWPADEWSCALWEAQLVGCVDNQVRV